MDVPAPRVVAETGELLAGEPLPVRDGGRAGEPAAVPSHDLVDDEHPRVRRVLGDDVPGEDRALLGGGPGAEALPDRDDVVVDRLGQPDDGELVAVLVEVRCEVGRGRVRVVATDRVEDVDTVLRELLRGHVQRVLALLHETALDAVRDVGQLDPTVADRATAETVEQVRLLADLGGHDEVASAEQPGVAVEVSDDLDVRGHGRVALDEPADGGGQAGGKAARGEQGDAANGHDDGTPWVDDRSVDASVRRATQRQGRAARARPTLVLAAIPRTASSPASTSVRVRRRCRSRRAARARYRPGGRTRTRPRAGPGRPRPRRAARRAG